MGMVEGGHVYAVCLSISLLKSVNILWLIIIGLNHVCPYFMSESIETLLTPCVHVCKSLDQQSNFIMKELYCPCIETPRPEPYLSYVYKIKCSPPVSLGKMVQAVSPHSGTVSLDWRKDSDDTHVNTPAAWLSVPLTAAVVG